MPKSDAKRTVGEELIAGARAELSSRDDAARNDAACRFQRAASKLVRKLPDSEVTDFANQVNRLTLELLANKSKHAQLGGVQCIQALAVSDGTAITSEVALNLFGRNLLNIFPPFDSDMDTIKKAAVCIGKLAERGMGPLTSKFVSLLADKALEWLEHTTVRNEARRHSAALILSQLCMHQPMLMFHYVPKIFVFIFIVLYDNKLAVREAGLTTLKLGLSIWRGRSLYPSVYRRIEQGFSDGKEETVHGALLAAGAFVEHIDREYVSVTTYFHSVCDAVIFYKDHRNIIVQRAARDLMPTLARVSPAAFVSYTIQGTPYVTMVLNHLLRVIRKDKDRAYAINALAELALAIKDNMASRVDDVFQEAQLLLSKKARVMTEDLLKAVCKLVMCLAEALGARVTSQLSALIDTLFETGLHEPLMEALNSVARYVPDLRHTVQRRTLNCLSRVLQNADYEHPGSQTIATTAKVDDKAAIARSVLAAAPSYVQKKVSPKNIEAANVVEVIQGLKVLSLRTLRTFDFRGIILTKFTQRCIVPYLTNENALIREEAALTCAKLVVPDWDVPKDRIEASVVTGVLSVMLTTAISDRKSNIRRTVLRSLGPQLNRYLAKIDIVRLLCVCLHDDDFDTRWLALAVVGRLCKVNPSYTIPSLRTLLTHLITSLEFGTHRKTRVEHARMLGHLAHCAPRVVRPYVDAIMNVLQPKLQDAEVATSALASIGELAMVAGRDLRKHLPRFLPLVISKLQDELHEEQRESALKVLGQLVQSTGYVIKPYKDYPELLGLLFKILTEGKTASIRKEVIKVLGILGAQDPYEEKLISAKLLAQESSELEEQTATDVPPNPIGSEEYYMDVVINELIRVANSPSVSLVRNPLVRCFAIITVKSGSAIVNYLPRVIPTILQVIDGSDPSSVYVMFKELATIVSVVGPHMRTYFGSVIKSIRRCWLVPDEAGTLAASDSMHTSVMTLLGGAVQAIGYDIARPIQQLLAHFMRVFAEDDSPELRATVQALDVIKLLHTHLQDVLFSVVAAVRSICADFNDTPIHVREVALEVLALLISHHRLGDQASSTVHALLRLMVFEPALRDPCMTALLLLMQQMGADFERRGHLETATKVLKDIGSPSVRFEDYKKCIQTGVAFPTSDDIKLAVGPPTAVAEAYDTSSGATHINRTTRRFTLKLAREAANTGNLDWNDWISRFTISLLKESPSPALAAGQDLAKTHKAFSRRLFNTAFVSCALTLTESQQADMAEGLERAMSNNQVFMQMMLNVADFMSHYDKKIPLRISSKTLGSLAFECHAYAKALRYKEQEFQAFFDIKSLGNGDSTPVVKSTPQLLKVIEDLIEISRALNEPESARGVLAFAREHTDLSTSSTIRASWFEKLGEWDKALARYEEKLEGDPHNSSLQLSRLRCLDNVCRWTELKTEIAKIWPALTDKECAEAATLGCSAALGLGDLDAVARYLPFITTEGANIPKYEAKKYEAMVAISRGDMARAQELIDESRTAIEPVVTSLWNESYSRMYNELITLQQLAEMEEAIRFKATLSINKRSHICNTWRSRLAGCKSDPDVWLNTMKVHRLVLTPKQDVDTWVKYASLCRQTSAQGTNLALERAHNALVTVLGCDPSIQPEYELPHDQPRVTYSYIKYLWFKGQADDAVQHLEHLIEYLRQSQPPEAHPTRTEENLLLARCFHKLGQWLASPYLSSASTMTQLSDDLITRTIESFHWATIYDPTWYKAWHAWAFMSYEAVGHYERMEQHAPCLSHAIMALKGFFNSITLSTQNSLQDTLRLLTLWFTYGGHPDVAQTIAAGVRTVSIETWLQVIPQLIARIHINDRVVRGSVHDLLLQLGRAHPHALIFPLTVGVQNVKDRNMQRREAAESLLGKIREHSPMLVDQAYMVSEELIRVAILWNEKWHEALESSSKRYTEQDMDGMFQILQPLHQKMNEMAGAATEKEAHFLHNYGKDLREAWEWCRKYRRTNNSSDIASAWDHYYHVYRKISKNLPQLTSLDLREVSPKLKVAKKLRLVVPGTYQAKGSDLVYIDSFVPSLNVINSKQRPRKLTIRGTDGKDYLYLLKAHEDLRQDERVMQLFGLVNFLLESNPLNSNRHLRIRTYYVLPLSPNLGLIEWVPTCDTLHALIRDHRERQRVMLNMEVRLMLQMTPDFDQLTIMQKVEVFRYALANTPGDDLAKVLWLQSGDSETWLERRTNYTRSLAVLSMVGYVLGLGDRHPSNLMLDRKTGDIMHVDFGDCFEVAMQRPQFPEKIPFRLTRMLVAAMEVSGIEGNFRITSESVMGVLRANRDSVIAVLEAFVHDPLIDWFANARLGAAGGGNHERRPSMSGMAPLGEQQQHGLDSFSLGESFLGEASVASSMRHRSPPAAALAPNKRALDVLARIQDKLTGCDYYNQDEPLDVPLQVQRLISDATSHENLCQHYAGWCPFW